MGCVGVGVVSGGGEEKRLPLERISLAFINKGLILLHPFHFIGEVIMAQDKVIIGDSKESVALELISKILA
ncbi:hypothetical protein KAR48_02785 [bacterium]|nr:hypothetical protein [bacterium]